MPSSAAFSNAPVKAAVTLAVGVARKFDFGSDPLQTGCNKAIATITGAVKAKLSFLWSNSASAVVAMASPVVGADVTVFTAGEQRNMFEDIDITVERILTRRVDAFRYLHVISDTIVDLEVSAGLSI